ncbi:YfiT family bacillithiol transferase [Algoriphagus aquimarinus]|uniref:Putative metal-dependent hydrolase n=1 Tax=Algoriphagus aquimarinus TaxID=237018 RepID=A0A5C7B2B5_9BACT|nr:putative metal-dependent hydrolase [Algoriphagus aquimarinus]TXE14574.1 putative metal-dependent hydrolase [Algoriphagus aquimarinus]
MIDIELLKYPIGKFLKPENISDQNLKEASAYLGSYPQYLKETVKGFSEIQLNTPYRPGGWSVRQVIHHVADSHMNALTRFKLALTEVNPTIKPYDEAAWAKMSDYSLPIESSLNLIVGIHFKWAVILESMTPSDFQKTYFHPESQSSVPLSEVTLMYQWHSMHHLAHIQHLIIREKW